MARTKDEQFILCAYETASKLGDVNMVLDRHVIGQMAGIKTKGTDAICNLLAQANFIKKLSTTEFRLTPNGEALALRLLEEK